MVFRSVANGGKEIDMVTGATFIGGLVSLALTVWFVIFSVLVIQKLDKVIELLGKKMN